MGQVTDIILKISPVKQKNQTTWKKVSNKCIKQGVVEPLSEQGIIQAVDRLAFEIAQDGNWAASSGLTDEECDRILDNKIKQMDELIHVIALASGIHPTSIDFIVGIRTDHYIAIYADMIDHGYKY